MAEARYEILVPLTATQTESISHASADHLSKMLPNGRVHVEPARVVWVDEGQKMFVPVVYQGEDTPEADSYVKQAASYVGDVTNEESIIVSKVGKQGIQTWPIRNTAFSESSKTGTL